jgi:hypothetical protein
VIEEDAILNDNYVMIDFDLNSVTSPELLVRNAFDLSCAQDGRVNGLVLWFDILFDDGDETLELTTLPYDRSPHWSQTIFSFDSPIDGIADAGIHGIFEMKPNKRNPEIKISHSLSN